MYVGSSQQDLYSQSNPQSITANTTLNLLTILSSLFFFLYLCSCSLLVIRFFDIFGVEGNFENTSFRAAITRVV